MTADLFILDGRAYSWRQLCEGKQQAARRSAAWRQPALFELHDDCRPLSERTASGRYAEPVLPGYRRLQRRAREVLSIDDFGEGEAVRRADAPVEAAAFDSELKP